MDKVIPNFRTRLLNVCYDINMLKTFNVGDTVKIIRGAAFLKPYETKIGIVEKIEGNTNNQCSIRFKDGNIIAYNEAKPWEDKAVLFKIEKRVKKIKPIIKDSGEIQKFDTGAVRDTVEGKPRFDLIPPHALKRVADVYMKGAIKYDEWNWFKGIPFNRCIGSAMRHVEAFRRGETDEDHLGQAVFNLLAIMEFQDVGRKDLDDMKKYGRNEG